MLTVEGVFIYKGTAPKKILVRGRCGCPKDSKTAATVFDPVSAVSIIHRLLAAILLLFFIRKSNLVIDTLHISE